MEDGVIVVDGLSLDNLVEDGVIVVDGLSLDNLVEDEEDAATSISSHDDEMDPEQQANNVMDEHHGHEERLNALHRKQSKRAKRNTEDLDVGDHQGNTPLHIASASNAHDIVKLLLQTAADPRCMNESGKTPLDVAQSLRLFAVVVDCCVFVLKVYRS